jgi:hypothetical protein
VINSERAALISPDFKGKMVRTNKQLLEDITNTFIEKAREHKGVKASLLGNNEAVDGTQQNASTT